MSIDYSLDIPASLKKWADNHQDIIKAIDYEHEDGYWLYLHDGYINDGMHLIHEYSIKDLKNKFKYTVKEQR